MNEIFLDIIYIVIGRVRGPQLVPGWSFHLKYTFACLLLITPLATFLVVVVHLFFTWCTAYLHFSC